MTSNYSPSDDLTPSAQARRLADLARLRIAVGLGDPEREQRLLPLLGESGEFLIVERCLAADPLLACVRDRHVDAVLVAFDLHRLSRGVLVELEQTRVPLVILTPDPVQEPWASLPGVVLPLDAGAEVVRQALTSAVRGERHPVVTHDDEPDDQASELAPPLAGDTQTVSVIALASGQGSPGRTTIAVNLAAALGAVAPTVLVDADLSGPSIAAYLDADPTHNLYMLAHAEPQSQREWDYAIEQETQPLAVRSPGAHVLCGLPKPELRPRLSAQFGERLVRELQRRYRYVVLDVGVDLLGGEVGLHRTALGLADQILLVTAADLVSLWHGRTALNLVQMQLSIPTERVALVLNCYDHRYHHSRTEIEWALRTPTAAVIPHDHRAVQHALAQQRPLIHVSRGRASRALLDLADRIHGQRIVLPPEPTERGWLKWPRWLPRTRSKPSSLTGLATLEREITHGDEPGRERAGLATKQSTNGRARPT